MCNELLDLLTVVYVRQHVPESNMHARWTWWTSKRCVSVDAVPHGKEVA
jgi:hypothetical protein